MLSLNLQLFNTFHKKDQYLFNLSLKVNDLLSTIDNNLLLLEFAVYDTEHHIA